MTVFAQGSDTSVAVTIAWRPQPDRMAAFERVMEWWRSHGLEPVLMDSDPDKPFNLSQARNRGVRAVDTDVVFIADADTIPNYRALRTAVHLSQYERVIYPFTEYRYLADSVDPLDDSIPLEDLPFEREYKNSYGGLMVIRPELYWAIGGHDEKFERWGFEDTAFQLAADCFFQTERVPGTVYAFNHTADRDLSTENPGRSRIGLYRYARRDPAMMRELIR